MRASSPTTCSVIVPTRDRPAQLGRFLSAIAAQTGPPESFEVIVVDDGGALDPESAIGPYRRRLPIELIHQSPAGPAAARNRGARSAAAGLIAFIDDDAVPSPRWIETLLRAHDMNPGCALGGPVIALDASSAYSRATQAIADSARNAHGGARSPRFLSACNLAAPADQIHELGGFDVGFRVSEDRELCDRWLERGWGIRFLPEAIVWHEHPASLGKFWRTHLHYGRGAFAYHRRRARMGGLGDGLQVSQRTLREALARGLREPSLLLQMAVWQVSNACGVGLEAFAWVAPGARLGPPPLSARGRAPRPSPE
jgi:GT2 family glycosyltransferase